MDMLQEQWQTPDERQGRAQGHYYYIIEPLIDRYCETVNFMLN